jgi:localization factor PodJL
MTSGVPWQIEARETAREAARRSGVSLGEWVDSVINNRGEADARPVRTRQYRDEEFGAAPAEAIAQVRGRLDEVGRQLDQLTRLNTAPAYQQPVGRGDEPRGDLTEAISRLDRRLDQLTGHLRQEETPSPSRPSPAQPSVPPSTPLEQALAEIAERQRTLDGSTALSRGRPARAEDPPRPPAQDLSGLEQQLRKVTTHIETLRPCGIEAALDTLRDDLAEIALMVKEAMPRQAIEALQNEVRSLSERLHMSPQSDATDAAFAGVEHGLAEVRDALHALTPAENLAGVGGSVRDLSRPIDLIATDSQDAGALEQIAGAITDLHGVVTQVASNGAAARLSDELAELGARVEQIASSSTTGTELLATLEHRIASIADALEARHEGGQTTPGDLNTVVRGLLDKLEGGGFARFDQAGVGMLEERIAALVDKLDTSSSRLDQLETVERGLTDLMATIDRRSQQDVGASAEPSPEVSSLRRDMQETRDSLKGVQGALGNLLERLATIESDMRRAPVAQPASSLREAAGPAAPAAPTFISEGVVPPARPGRATEPEPGAAALHERRAIDPSLPPDHPLEPGAMRSRNGNSPGDRIAASEAALAATKPPIIPEPAGKSNFIAAARRAAQAASTEAPRADKPATVSAVPNGKAAKGWSNRVRAVLVAASVVVIVLGSLHVVASLFNSEEPEHAAPPEPGRVTAPEAAPGNDAKPDPDAAEPAPGRQSLIDAQSPANAIAVLPPLPPAEAVPEPAAVPVQGSTAAPEPDSAGVSKPPASISIPAAKPAAAAPQSPPTQSSGIDKLPPTFSNVLRTAAAKGDPGAQYEIALRFADGRGVPQNLAEAADWFDRAAKQGMVLAQFRLGGFYEKGFGVKKDLAAARRLYESAAEAGNAKAMHNLAVIYAEGIDGKPDYATAAKWFRQAASYGLTDSQYNLGILYARGIGVEVNLPDAYKWFTLAAREGDKEAASKRDDVGGRLDQRQLAAARLDAQKWTALQQPEAATQALAPSGGWDPIVPAPAPVTPKPRNPGARAEALSLAPPH